MAIQQIKAGQRKTATASGADPLAVEFFALGEMVLDVIINKPTGATLSLVKVSGGASETLLSATDNEVTSGQSLGIRGIRMLAGDEVRAVIDTTTGAKIATGEAYD